MCLPDAPEPPAPPPERQAARQPDQDVRTRLSDVARRRRGYAATMHAAPSAGPASTSNILGV
jgi:hypothetical protein